MSIRIYTTSEENTAYMQGYVRGRAATGLDWGVAEKRVLDEQADKKKAWAEMHQIKDAALARIHELEAEIETMKREHEAEVIDLESQIKAYKLAFQCVNRDLESAQNPKKKRRLWP